MTSQEGVANDQDAAWIVPKIPVVGIGASAGGIKALQDFFEALPGDTGAAFVVIVHLDPQSHSELPEILAARSRMSVTQVTNKAELRRNSIYVIPPDRQLRITDDEIAAERFEEPRGHRTPIDLFFRSLAEQRGDGFAIVLTGAGSDGALGVKAAKEAGGIILVQDPDEAEYSSMPRSAIATGAVDFVLRVRDLAAHLVELVQSKQQVAAAQKGDEEEQMRRVLAHLNVRTGHDFTHYKRSTLMRRILRRMQVTRKETIEGYFAFLRETPEEAQALLADLLISVTAFFRDPKAFGALSRHAIPHLFENANESNVIRVWIPGCATGEEAYSIAMLLLEEASRHDLRPEIQVFATDLDAKALAIAREGRYPAAIEADLNEDRLRRFFARDAEMYRVKRELRDVVLFANHSILKDPPFSRLDMVSCRNLLIYLDRELQQQVLMTLHYGLKPEGYLFLGNSESAEHPDGLFRAVNREARLYQSDGRGPSRFPMFPRLLRSIPSVEQASTVHEPRSGRSHGTESLHREALEEAAPPSILVDRTFRVLHLSETAGAYVKPSRGPMTADVIELVREELRFELRSALHRAFEGKEPVLSTGIFLGFDGHRHRIYIQAKPISEPDGETRRALILFVEGQAEEEAAIDMASGGRPTNEAVSHLRQELEAAQSRLRTSREESEGANEELRAANEELQSINEEYRSTAEELETSKEELQSINEELQTVNAELKLKLETVSRANSDMQNLMAATDFATLFLDQSLRIKRFTPRLTELFSITPNDIGRPITDFTHQLDYDALPADARLVLTHLTPFEREIRSRTGGWYLVRFRPYRTVDDKIDGVVATFLDVTERRTMTEELRQENKLVELSRAPLFVWELEGRILKWNRGSEELYGYAREEAIGQTKEVLLKTTVPGSSFGALKEVLVRDGSWKGELNHISKDGRHLTVESQIELVAVGERRYVLESTRDVTESKAWAARQQLLLRELTHRVKNTLAVVQSMVHQTWRTSPPREEFIKRLDGRISALAKSHKLFVETEWEGAELQDLIDGQISPVGVDPSRVQYGGPKVNLPPDLAMPLGLVLHELATNAAKFGSLSDTKGIVSLTWATAGKQNSLLRVFWQEQGGPPVKGPTTIGFGSRLIRTGVPGSTVQLEFLPGGVQCTIEIPMSKDGESEHGG